MFSTSRIRNSILLDNLAGNWREHSVFNGKSLYQCPNERVSFYIRWVKKPITKLDESHILHVVGVINEFLRGTDMVRVGRKKQS